MLAAVPSARPFSLPLLIPHPGRRASTFAIVAAGKHPRRRSRSSRPALEESFDETSSSEGGLDAFELGSPQDTGRLFHHPPPAAAAANVVAFEGGASEPQEGHPREASAALRGTDVLRALQKAVAEKEMQKEKNRSKKKPPSRRNAVGATSTNFDFESVRPIQIPSDWSARIEELEQRVRELRSRYH